MHVSVGGRADSAHEYLLKQYLLTAKTDKTSLEMCASPPPLVHIIRTEVGTDLRTTTHILSNLLYVSPKRGLLYVTDVSTPTHEHAGRPSHKMEHLACFLPGLLALGAHTLPLDDLAAHGIDLRALGEGFGWAERGYAMLARAPSLREVHMWAAAGLADTCYMLYADQPTGLAPEDIVVKPAEGGGRQWLDEVEAWRRARRLSGRRFPPGVGQSITPVVYTEQERLTGTGKGRDYVIRNPMYLLRPEVCVTFNVQGMRLNLFPHRQWSHCTSCGALRATRSGATWAGGSSRPLSERRVLWRGTRAFELWRCCPVSGSTVCPGKLPCIPVRLILTQPPSFFLAETYARSRYRI